ncbi:MAG: 5'/3'-nucleotidase SurE [Nitrososphaerota archaeon]|nr:5'/3'-nucleotidase SurE [Nitrososphaerota archaeon]
MIMISNDDGPRSTGLKALIEALKDVDYVTFSIPEGPRSGSSMSLTFHKPIRTKMISIAGVDGMIVSGSPADAVMTAHILFDKKPDIVVTGINLGDNTGLQDIHSSGTVAGAMQAALLNYPAIAFSKKISEEFSFMPSRRAGDFRPAARVAAAMTRYVMQHGLPQDVSLLNVNFPMEISDRTEIMVTEPSAIKYDNYLDKRKDPRGQEYYWLWGKRMKEYPEGTDAHALLDLNNISITPMTLRNQVRPGGLEGLVGEVRSSISQ